MISIEEAFKAVLEHTEPISSSISIPLGEALHMPLSIDVYSPIDMPPFRQSAMDGYAVSMHEALSYTVLGEVKAGDSHHPKLGPGEAVRIFTGAPVPDTANAIVIQEKVIVAANTITINEHPKSGQHIRPVGEQVKGGNVALKKGTVLTPAGLGYLSSLGIEEVAVYRKPQVAIVTTGDELIAPGKPLTYGKIYESNSLMLKSTFKSLGIDEVKLFKVADHFDTTLSTISQALETHDLVVITGGISVGDYDLVGKALTTLGVEEVFYKVKQKPGKPLYFGKKGNARVFALPGNPAAALTCFYRYVYPAMQKMSGLDHGVNKVQAISDSHFTKKGDRPQFLKAIYKAGRITILDGQSSSMLQTFAHANALVHVPEDLKEIQLNDKVEVILLPVVQ